MSIPLPPNARCALGNEAIATPPGAFMTSGQFLPKNDALQRYCGKPICWPCYERWPERPRFAQAYVGAWVTANRKNPFWWQVHLDDAVYIAVNPQRSIEEASIRLLAVGDDLRVKLPEWKQWLAAPAVASPITDFERDALEAVLPDLRARFPDGNALVDAIDPAEKKR